MLAERKLAVAVLAGIATGISDFLFASILTTAMYGSTFTRLWQGVAATLLGKAAFEGGLRTVGIGILMHFGVALGWSVVLVGLVARSSWIRAALAARYGPIRVASIYGPAIWMVMSLIVIPILLRRPPHLTARWWIQGLGHIPFVALPMAVVIKRGLLSASPTNR